MSETLILAISLSAIAMLAIIFVDVSPPTSLTIVTSVIPLILIVLALNSSTITSSPTPNPLTYPVIAVFTSFSTAAIDTPSCKVISSSKIISVTVGARI